jgi:hypothetical protein
MASTRSSMTTMAIEGLLRKAIKANWKTADRRQKAPKVVAIVIIKYGNKFYTILHRIATPDG